MSDRIPFGITSFVKGNIAGKAQAAVSNISKSAIRSISGLSREGNNSDLASRFNLGGGGKYGTALLAYPFDVETDQSQGHHIMFTVRIPDAAKIKQIKARKEFAKIIRDMRSEISGRENILARQAVGGEITEEEFNRQQAEINIDRTLVELDEADRDDGIGLSAPSSSGRGENRSIQRTSRPTVRTGTAIALYMPPNVQVSYEVKTADEKIGSLAQIGLGAIEAFRTDQNTTDKLRSLKEAVGNASTEGFTNVLNATLDTVAPGARSLQQLDSGKVITPRMELMFEGVGRRSFNYTFVFIPKSEQEAKIVERIIQVFKENMMPEYTNETTRREMKIPNTFDISYRYRNAENSFLNKISECFLTKADVQYGADRFTAYESTKSIHGSGPPPQKTTLTLAFTELEVLSKESIKQGF